jgi:hypothetical protein
MWGKAVVGIVGSIAIAIAGCGSAATTATHTTAASSAGSSVPAFQRGTPSPEVTAGLIAQAGYGLTQDNMSLGTVDEVFGSVTAGVRVNPSAKNLNAQYARFGRCMGEHLRIHDQGHELALPIAYNRKNPVAQAAVEKASTMCVGSAITDASYKQSLNDNP